MLSIRPGSFACLKLWPHRAMGHPVVPSTSACQNSASRHLSSGSLGSGSRFIKASPRQALLWGGPYSGWAALCPPALMTLSMRLGSPCPEPDHPFCPPTPAPADGRKRGDSAGLGETTHHGTQAWEEEAWESSHDRALESNVHGIGVGTTESHSPNRENVGRSGVWSPFIPAI